MKRETSNPLNVSFSWALLLLAAFLSFFIAAGCPTACAQDVVVTPLDDNSELDLPVWEEYTRGRTVCDGDGNITYMKNPNWTGSVLCLEEHEMEHAAFIDSYYPDVCEGKPDGDPILLDPSVVQLSECLAYVVSLECYLRADLSADGMSLWRDVAVGLYGCELSSAKKELQHQRQQRRQQRRHLKKTGDRLDLILALRLSEDVLYLPVPATTWTAWKAQTVGEVPND